jgi:glycerol-3-phosphate dehydrogenase
MALTADQLAAAFDRAGMTEEKLDVLLPRLELLFQRDVLNSMIANVTKAQQDANQQAEAQKQALQAQLTAIQEQIDSQYSPGG